VLQLPTDLTVSTGQEGVLLMLSAALSLATAILRLTGNAKVTSETVMERAMDFLSLLRSSGWR